MKRPLIVAILLLALPIISSANQEPLKLGPYTVTFDMSVEGLNWTIDEPVVSTTPGGSPSITYHATGKNDHLVNITIQECNFTPEEGPDTFEIADVEYPEEVQSNGAKGGLAVYWSGDPQFPVKVVYRPKGCQPGLTCTSPEMTFDVRQNPLVFPESVWCAGVGNSYFDYEVVMVDARGIESAPYPAPFTCRG